MKKRQHSLNVTFSKMKNEGEKKNKIRILQRTGPEKYSKILK